MNDKDFTAMVCSKILHDLAGPIGAVMNGAELIEESEVEGMEDILEMLKSSSEQLTALLQVFRVGFGALSTGGEEVDVNMVQTHLADYTKFKGVPVTWQPEEASIDKTLAKLLVNSVFLLADLARKKGQLQISCSDAGNKKSFSVAAFGQGITAPEEMRAFFMAGERPEVSTGNVPAYIIIGLAEEAGLEVSLNETQNGVILQGQSKG